MGTVTITLPDEIKAELKRFAWVNWSEAARDELIVRAKRQKDFEEFSKLVSNSKLTDEDVKKLADDVNAGMLKRLKGEHPGFF